MAEGFGIEVNSFGCSFLMKWKKQVLLSWWRLVRFDLGRSIFLLTTDER
ncbi:MULTISPECIES: hypothetical protein [unclassified Microcoleus]